jgi:hypothetical protein
MLAWELLSLKMNREFPSCDLFILSAVTDLSFLRSTLPHQIRQCQVNGTKYLRIDTSPVSGYYRHNRELSKLSELRTLAKAFLNEGLIDEILEINYNKTDKRAAYLRHFGIEFEETHCFRGYPYYGSIIPFEISNAEYVAHLDSDMLLYQQENFDWIQQSIQIMEKNDDIICCLPLSGPPACDSKLHQGTTEHTLDRVRNLYLFKNFTSRIFVMNVKRFLSLCPLKISWLSWREPIKSKLFGNGKMLCWETSVTEALKKSSLYRADLFSKSAWSLHPPERSERFNAMIPNLIKEIEVGNFPAEQAGRYDLNLDWWI